METVRVAVLLTNKAEFRSPKENVLVNEKIFVSSVDVGVVVVVVVVELPEVELTVLDEEIIVYAAVVTEEDVTFVALSVARNNRFAHCASRRSIGTLTTRITYCHWGTDYPINYWCHSAGSNAACGVSNCN